ncbi:MAG: 6-carboxytetrahydropterin synthase [Caldilineaceae bacterium]|nr:6-carboxytetrahydropterin synthase [Caldilineaceae bacterium]
MYTLAVKRDFVAQHYLIGGDWGAENEWHSHHYALELQLSGETLDEHGYLVDIVDVERRLDELVARFRDKTLNDFPEFADRNPSIERFAAVLCRALTARIQAKNLTCLRVVVWENEIAWAAYETRMDGA